MKWAIIGSVAWFILVVVAAILLMWYAWENRIGGRANFEERVAQMGSGAGMLAGIGVGLIWAVWLFRRKKEKG